MTQAAVQVVAQAGVERGGQSVLQPASAFGHAVTDLFWVMTIAGAVIWAIVMLLAWLAARRQSRSPRAARWLVVLGGLVITPAVLAVLLWHGLALIPMFREPDAAVTVQVRGEQYWWHVAYQTPRGERVTANEIVVPVGVRTEFLLRSDGVIHSFWIPSLAGKVDMIPGRTNRLVVEPDRTGVFRGQCAEFCGTSHAFMAFDVRVLEPAAFDAWLARQAEPARDPVLPLETEGYDVFFETGCQACHAIRGTPAAGVLGPDLTHYGLRASVAAGLFPNNVGTTAGWIASAATLKPGNQMPSFGTQLSGAQLRAVSAYLTSLQ